MLRTLLPIWLVILTISPPTWGQHAHDGKVAQSVIPPTIYLDKSPRIVEYQLKRLSNEQLLLVERSTAEPKYAPVFHAILTREGMPRAVRDEALAGLVELKKSDPVSELCSVLLSMKSDDAAAQRIVRSLAMLLLEVPAAELKSQTESLSQLAAGSAPQISAIGYAALVASGQSAEAWSQAGRAQALPQLLAGIAQVPSQVTRNAQHSQIIALLDSQHSPDVRRAALAALATISSGAKQTFQRAAALLPQSELQPAAVKTLLSVSRDERDAATSEKLIEWLVNFAEKTPAAERTSDSFLDAMELVDQLLASAPSDMAKSYRARLRETVVRVVRIHTVEEEMRYDIPYFAVEAGRPVQVVLINEDMMPHNLVFTVPGALQEVADAGLEVGPTGGLDGKQYVPNNGKVLHATDMVAAREQAVLTFTAPAEPGEYPYVCTFPRHWMRMYGVMVVVTDLDAWQKNPIAPKDPIGSNRQFVQSWTAGDFEADLPGGLRGRLPRIGEKLFVEATCAQCHKLGSVGVGNVGPDLSQVFARWKNDPAAVLREIVDPSHRIDDKYAVHILITLDGQTVSGLIVGETKDSISIMENPEAKEARVIAKDEIDEMQKTANSMMPKGLLDRYSKDEVLEILAYIQGLQQPL